MVQPTFAATDVNDKNSLTAVSNTDSTVIVRLTADPLTGALLVTGGGGGGGGTGTWYAVTGTIDGSNVTFTIAVAVTSDFLLCLARQPQMQGVSLDYTYSAGASTTTITYNAAPDASLNGQPHQAFVIS